MTHDDELRASQAAYAARPFCTVISSSHYKGSWRFNTESEAVDYLFQQAALVKRIIRNREYGTSWVNFDCFRSYIAYPDGSKIEARWFLFEDTIATR